MPGFSPANCRLNCVCRLSSVRPVKTRPSAWVLDAELTAQRVASSGDTFDDDRLTRLKTFLGHTPARQLTSARQFAGPQHRSSSLVFCFDRQRRMGVTEVETHHGAFDTNRCVRIVVDRETVVGVGRVLRVQPARPRLPSNAGMNSSLGPSQISLHGTASPANGNATSQISRHRVPPVRWAA